jgi:hypothetical protein
LTYEKPDAQSGRACVCPPIQLIATSVAAIDSARAAATDAPAYVRA